MIAPARPLCQARSPRHPRAAGRPPIGGLHGGGRVPGPPRELPPRDDDPGPQAFVGDGESIRVEFWGDNEVVCAWCNGTARVMGRREVKQSISFIESRAMSMWSIGAAFPRHSTWYRHQYREYNAEADSLAGHAADTGCCEWRFSPVSAKNITNIRAMFDGSHRNNRTAVGWMVQVAHVGIQSWVTIASCGHCIPTSDSCIAELTAACEVITAVSNYILRGVISLNSDGSPVDAARGLFHRAYL